MHTFLGHNKKKGGGWENEMANVRWRENDVSCPVHENVIRCRTYATSNLTLFFSTHSAQTRPMICEEGERGVNFIDTTAGGFLSLANTLSRFYSLKYKVTKCGIEEQKAPGFFFVNIQLVSHEAESILILADVEFPITPHRVGAITMGVASNGDAVRVVLESWLALIILGASPVSRAIPVGEAGGSLSDENDSKNDLSRFHGEEGNINCSWEIC